MQEQIVPTAAQRRAAFADVADGLDRRVEERVRAPAKGKQLGGVSFAERSLTNPFRGR